MHFLDPDTVPTMGDWFRAAGYRTHYRGKWHISHPDLVIPGTHESLRANDADGVLDPVAVDAYRRADRLDPYGFSGWIGREPHGADKADTGFVRDGVFAQEIVDLFARIDADDDAPWLAVASFVNPHDIAFTGAAWQLLGFPAIADSIPEIPEAPSQSDSFTGRPGCQRQFKEVWPRLLYPQETDGEYRRLYHFLQVLVDAAIMRILDELEARGLADDTIVVFTSDHGDMLGAHGGMMQKWHNAFDEAIRVPMLVSGPGVDTTAPDVEIATSHVDLIPTLLGLVGADVEAATGVVARHHVETQPFVGRDLSALVPFESLTNKTLPWRPTCSMRCASPGNDTRARAIVSGVTPSARAAAVAQAAFCALCKPRREPMPPICAMVRAPAAEACMMFPAST
jgi:arylsulfatase A-like enzyme